MITDKNFSGRNGFIWYTGVVEDRNDPQYLGRVRVRCIGIHTDDKIELLTWTCMGTMRNALTGASISGLGNSPGFLLKVHGCLVTLEMVRQCKNQLYWVLYEKSFELSNTDKGFYDPNGVYPKYKDEVDTNRLAVNLQEDGSETNPHLSLTIRRSTRITGVATADFQHLLQRQTVQK